MTDPTEPLCEHLLMYCRNAHRNAQHTCTHTRTHARTPLPPFTSLARKAPTHFACCFSWCSFCELVRSCHALECLSLRLACMGRQGRQDVKSEWSQRHLRKMSSCEKPPLRRGTSEHRARERMAWRAVRKQGPENSSWQHAGGSQVPANSLCRVAPQRRAAAPYHTSFLRLRLSSFGSSSTLSPPARATALRQASACNRACGEHWR